MFIDEHAPASTYPGSLTAYLYQLLFPFIAKPYPT
jgi:hypothetical protein